jgi:hypothetical protein
MTHALRLPLAASALLLFATTGALAQTISVRCDTWSDRSRAFVDATGLADGAYNAAVSSGPHQAISQNSQNADGGEVQFDFDSSAKEIRNGATPIGKHFIVNDKVTGQILATDGTVIATQTKKCKQH